MTRNDSAPSPHEGYLPLPLDMLDGLRRLQPPLDDLPVRDAVRARVFTQLAADDDLGSRPARVRTATTAGPPRRSRHDRPVGHRMLGRWAVAASLVAVLTGAVITVTVDALADRISRPAASAPQLGAAADHWERFPVGRTPRPVVLLGADVADPAGGFGTAAAKQAWATHDVRMPAVLPASAAERDGYAVMPAADAIARVTGGPSTTAPLTIASVTLTDHQFSTDRGEQLLPAWALRIDGVADEAFVLAVAADQRFALPDSAPETPQTRILVARDADISVTYVPDHSSTGPCDPGFRESVDVQEQANVVFVTVTRRVDTAAASNSGTYCTRVGDPSAIAADTTDWTTSLGEPVGDRPVVTSDGLPWTVEQR